MTYRILHVISGLGTGGAENALFRLLRNPRDQNFESQVISLRDDGAMADMFRDNETLIEEVGFNRRPLRGMQMAIRAAKAFRPNIVHGWMNHGNVAALLIRSVACPDAALIWGIRQSIYAIKLEKPLTRAMIRIQSLFSAFPDVILFNSALALDQHLELGFKNKRMEVIYNGFDTSALTPSLVRKQNLRGELGISDAAPVVAIVGRSHPMKDHSTFIRSIPLVRRRYPDLQVILVGRELDSSASGLFALATSLGVADICHFLGERHELEHVYPAFDVMCLSSAWGEGFPNVLGEAMACGVPCVTTDVGDAAYVVGDTGYVVPLHDCDAMALRVCQLLNRLQTERQALSAAARDRIEREFSIESMREKYCAIYEALLSA